MFTRYNRTQRGRRLLSVLVALALVLPVLPVTAGAVSLTDTVSLQITTGESAGDGVLYIGLKYLDVDGVLHEEFLFPHKEGLYNSFEQYKSLGTYDNGVQQEMKKAGLADEWDYGGEKAFRSYSTDTLCFKLPYEIDQDDPNWFQGLDFYCAGESGDGRNIYNWDIQGLRIYTGGQCNMYMTGGALGQYKLVPYGKRAFTMEEQNGGRSLSWTSDMLFQFGTGRDAYVTMKPDSGEFLPQSEDEYYTFRIDFADVYGAGIDYLTQEYLGEKSLASYMDGTGGSANPDISFSSANPDILDILFGSFGGNFFNDVLMPSTFLPSQIDPLINNFNRDSYIGEEALVMEVQYTDIWGDVIRVNIPVLTSVLLSLNVEAARADSAIENPFGELVLLGWAQQGETIALSAQLPNLSKISRVTFHSGSEASKRTDYSVVEEESVSITNVSVYEGRGDGSLNPDEKNGVLFAESDGNDLNDVFVFRSKPLFYHTAANYSGETIVKDSSHTMIMSEYVAGSNLKPVNSNERYLVELKAEQIGFYDVPDEIFIQIKYRTVKGEQRETSRISVRNAVSDFYGNWPASTEDFAYRVLMFQEGGNGEFGGVKFIVELRDVEYFSGVVLDTGDTSSDWQMTGIQITKLDSVDIRQGEWSQISLGGVESDRVYSRATYGEVVFTMNETILVQPGQNEEMDFTSGSVVDNEDVDWSEVKYSMSFEESCANFGFAKSRENYTVEVKVSGDTTSMDGNGDNGSKNQFFFQLEFETGNSGYVLANQQLSADGFRSGYNETFTVTTNRNYGELVAVHIIPDDTSEDSDVYDKLNIEEIKVRRNTTDSISRQWTVSEVGWIGIDYHDEGAGASIGGQGGRTEAEISRVYPVTYSSYGVNLMFNINTGSYDSANANANTDPFYGTIGGILWYTNSVGELVSYSFDLVEAVYKYANRDPVYGTDESGKKTMALNDTHYMFRGNHTDRFFLSVDDIVQVNRLELNVTTFPGSGNTWTINNVAIQQVLSDGVLHISDDDEYVRTNETKPLCANVNEDGTEAVKLALPQGEKQTYTIYFPENKIDVDDDNFTWVSSVSREPASQNDEINIYIYPTYEVDEDDSIDASAMYTNAFGNRWRTGAENLIRYNVDGRQVFSVSGLSASGMSSLNSLTIKVDTGREVDEIFIDYAVVQQVRAGVVINSYYLECGDQNASLGVIVEPGNVAGTTYEEQVVSIALGDATETANLLPEVRDIAVALRYTSSNESTGREYLSRYAFLTDEQYSSIRAGNVLTVKFQEDYVREITGVVLVSSGGIVAEVSGVCVGTYSVTPGGTEESTARSQTAWYSFANGAVLRNSSATLAPTPGAAVYPLRIQFTTAGAGGTTESGTDTPVAMRLGYKTADGSSLILRVDDVRKYVTSSGSPFETGSVTEIKMLVEDVDELRWMELEPYDEVDSKATLKLESIVALLGDEVKVKKASRTLSDNVIFEENDEEPYRVNLSDVSVEFKIRAINPDTGVYDAQAHTVKSSGSVVKLVTKSEGGAKIESPKANDSVEGYTVTTELIAAEDSVSSMNHLTHAAGGDTWIFTAPANKSESSLRYRITIASVEVPDVAAVVEIVVMSDATPIEDILQDIIGGMTSGSETGGDSGTQSGDAENAQPEEVGDSAGTGSDDAGTAEEGTTDV